MTIEEHVAASDAEKSQTEHVARSLRPILADATGHQVWFDGLRSEPRVAKSVSVDGEGWVVRLASCSPSTRPPCYLTPSQETVKLTDPQEWWDYEIIGCKGWWTLTAKAPSHMYPGWGRREVAWGTLTDDGDVLGLSIRCAAAPLEMLVREHERNHCKTGRKTRRKEIA